MIDFPGQLLPVQQVLDEARLVELLTLAGYFAMVCWVMNVARTPGPRQG